jgi:hypothetical protein
MESIPANDLLQWEKWNVSNSVTAQQSVEPVSRPEAKSGRNNPSQTPLFPSNLGKRKPIVEKLVTNVSQLGSAVWSDIFQ